MLKDLMQSVFMLSVVTLKDIMLRVNILKGVGMSVAVSWRLL